VESSFGFIGPVRKAYVRDGVICEVAKDAVVNFRKAKRKDEIATPAETDRGMRSCPWLVRSTALVNQFYVHCADREFGPCFLKFCTYIPYNAKLCLNAHEYVKRQLDQKRIGYQALDNGILLRRPPARTGDL
jgi:hypothetical protein